MASGIVESSSSGSQDKEQQSQQATRSRLVSRLLAASPDLPAFLNDLITTQAVVVAGTEAAAFIIKRGQQSGFMLDVVAHVRPDGADEDTRQQALGAFKELVFPCVQQGRDGAIELEAGKGSDEGQYCLVTLLRNETDVVAVSAVITRCRDAERAQQRLVSMQLVAGYFDLYMLRRKSEQALTLAQGHQDVLQYATAVGTADNFQQSAANLCNAMATRTGAVRVSLGWVKGINIRVKALSHTENFDKRQELIRVLERVMEESADQDEPVYFNPTPEIGEASTQNVTREAAAYSRFQGGNAILSLPLRKGGDICGALVLEWAPKTALPAGAVNAMTVAADVLSPQLDDRFQNDRWLLTKTGLSAKDLGHKIIGPKYMVGKLVGTLLALAVIGLFAYQPMYRVSAPFQFSAVEKRIINAPFDGYLGKLGTVDGHKLLAGMKVKAGDVLATMDTTEAELERAKALSEAGIARNEAIKALAENKMADSNVARERERSSLAQADLAAKRIERAQIIAPFDGEIVKNELEDRVGSQVKAGEELFQLVQIDKLRVEMSVKEADIQLIHLGARGQVATTSLPGERYGFTVDRIVPQGEAKEGNNVFTVYAKLDNEPREAWRPGMAGEAMVDTTHKPIIYRYTRRFVDFVRLQVWKWL